MPYYLQIFVEDRLDEQEAHDTLIALNLWKMEEEILRRMKVAEERGWGIIKTYGS